MNARVRVFAANRKKGRGWSRRQLELQTMIWPGILFLLIFSYIPMYGVIIAFQRYSPVLGIMKSPWVGLKYFRELFADDNIYRALRNSLAINLLELVISFPAPILLAVLLNEVRSSGYKRVVQTISYLPHFVSWVIYGGLVIVILRPNTGALNTLLKGLGWIEKDIAFLARPSYFWMILVLSSMVKGVGWGSIVYLAAMAGIDQEMYDAALVDGAGRFARMRYITLPSIKTQIMIMLIFAIAGILGTGFDRVYVLQNGLNVSTSEVFETYTYKIGLEKLQFSYSTAVGLVNSIVSVILLLVANVASRKLTEESLF